MFQLSQTFILMMFIVKKYCSSFLILMKLTRRTYFFEKILFFPWNTAFYCTVNVPSFCSCDFCSYIRSEHFILILIPVFSQLLSLWFILHQNHVIFCLSFFPQVTILLYYFFRYVKSINFTERHFTLLGFLWSVYNQHNKML